MKKILLIILLISLTGCGSVHLGEQNINKYDKPENKHLKLKVSKDKILGYKEKTTYRSELVLGNTATSTVITPEYVLIPEIFIEYDYISEEIATNTPYFDVSNKNIYTNAEKLDKVVAYYSENKWVKDEGVIKNIKSATTTIEAFDEQTKLSLLEKYIIKNALAVDTYTADGTYTPACDGNVEVLVVGGGAGGGGFGGGGAGGYRTDASYAVTVQSYDVTVGGGGAGATTGGAKGISGGNSIFGTITSAGGGGGGAFSNTNSVGVAGGSGGGGGTLSSSPYTGGAGGAGDTPDTTPDQGYAGGAGVTGATGGGGGGGASEVGANAVSTVGGNGGDGTANDISGSSVTYAGGGGGACSAGGTQGLGGAGGGGDGEISNSNPDATSGTANTGGGGGGSYAGFGGNAGNGGSGIVIVSFIGTCGGGGALIDGFSITEF